MVTSSNHLIKTISIGCSLHLTATSCFDINPSQSNSSVHFFFSARFVFFFFFFFASIRSRRDLLFCLVAHIKTQCWPAVFKIVNLQQVTRGYRRAGDVICTEMSHWACHSVPVTAGWFTVLYCATCLVLEQLLPAEKTMSHWSNLKSHIVRKHSLVPRPPLSLSNLWKILVYLKSLPDR